MKTEAIYRHVHLQARMMRMGYRRPHGQCAAVRYPELRSASWLSERLARGLTNTAIAAELRCCPTTVATALQWLGRAFGSAPLLAPVDGAQGTHTDGDGLGELQPEGEFPDFGGWFGDASGWWPPEPPVLRVDDGVSTRLDKRQRRARERALGNAIVPQVAVEIFKAINYAIEGAT